MTGVPTAIARNSPVTPQLSRASEESRSSAIVGSDAETMVIDELNTMIAARTTISSRRG